MSFEDLVSSVETLPPLSDSTLLIQKLYAAGADEVDIIKLVRIIESDALLAANILKLINSPLYGFSKQIASVSQAVTLFGTEKIFGLVLNYAIGEKIQASLMSYGISNAKFNDICQLQSLLVSQWYARVDLRQSQFLATLALIMESGKLILSHEISESNYMVEFVRGLRESSDLAEYEYSLFDTTSYFISSLLFEHWNLEPLYIEILKGLDFEYSGVYQMEVQTEVIHVIRTAINVREVLTDESIEKAALAVEDLNLDAEHFKNVAHRIKKSFESKKEH